MEDPWAAIQPLEHLYHRSGETPLLCVGQELQRVPAEVECVVSADPAPVLEAENTVEADTGDQGTVSHIWLLCLYPEALIETGQEVGKFGFVPEWRACRD